MKQTFLALLAIVAGALIAAPLSAQVPLGTAQNFGTLAGSTITNTGPTVVTGDVGVSPGSAVTGFPPGVVVGGAIHAGDATAAQAQSDLTTAYNTAAAIPCSTDLTGQNLGGLTLTPGVYCFSTSAALTGTLTLNMQGNPNAFFLFKIGSTLTTASGSLVVLTNNAGGTCPPNVFWQVGSSATLGTGSSFAGNILALTSVTMTIGSGLNGRALARNGAVTLDSNTITACATAAVVPPGDAAAIPALDPVALVILSVLLAAAGMFVMRNGS
ncbi:MAG TPA: ice-binding family protein [Thermoanaerobaculia bacterium]